MLSILRALIDIVVNLVEFVISTIQSFTNLISNIPKYTAFLFNNISTLPTILIPFCLASISIYIVFLILGRNN